MIRQATSAIARAFDAVGWRYTIDEVGDKSVLNASFNAKQAGSVRLRYISPDDDNDVAVRVFAFVKGSEAKADALLKAMNEINTKFRFIKLVLDKDFDVNIEYDIPQRCGDVGETAVELANRLVDIADDAFPVLMRALYT